MKRMTTGLLTTAALSLLAPVSANGQATFQLIENIIVPNGWSYCSGVSADGGTVFGDESGYGLGWRWNESVGFELIGGHRPGGASGDGKVIAGNTSPGQGVELSYAGKWSQATDWVSLGSLPGATDCDNTLGNAYDMGRDASIVSGLWWYGCQAGPLRWSADMGVHRMTMQDPVLHYAARANTVSGDGRFFGGWEANTFGTWRPVIWKPDATQIFPAPDPDETPGEVLDLSFDGTYALGYVNVTGFVDQPFRWSEAGGLEILPVPIGAEGMALGVSDDGRVMAGRYGFPPINLIACIWLDGVPYDLKQYLLDNGVTGIESYQLFNAIGVSADGTVITGTAYPNWGTDLRPVAFRATIPRLPDCPADVSPAGGDRAVNTDDFLAVLAGWGTCDEPCPPYCDADTNEDCAVDTDDFLAVLSNWGACEPLGACCSYDGTVCEDLTQLDCNTKGGVWNAAKACATYTCPGAPLGACCLPGQICVMLDERDCPWAGGIAWHAGEDCLEFTCPPEPTGACCLWPTDVCSMLSEYDCDQAGGDFHGVGVDCLTVTCPEAPQGDVIEDPYVIAALPYVDTNDTTGFRNDYYESCSGLGSPKDSPDVVYAYTPTVGQFVTISMCTNASPTYQARWHVYDDVEGNVIACESSGDPAESCPWWPYGVLIENLWLDAGHTYYIIVDGNRHNEEEPYTIEVSEPVYGACCAYPTTVCSDLTEFDCYQIGGGVWIWDGPGTTCATTSCPAPPQGDVIDDPIVVGALPYSDVQTFPEIGPVGMPGVFGDWYQDGILSLVDGGTYWSHGVDIIYTYTPAADETVDIVTCNTGTEFPSTMLYVYDGSPIFGDEGSSTFGNYIAFGDLDSCGVGIYQVGIYGVSLTAGHTYYIVVDSDCNEATDCGSGAYQLDIDLSAE